MKLDRKESLSVWLKGAALGAAKGIPLGLAMGVGAALLVWGAAVAFPALGLATAFSGFLFTTTAAGALGVNFVPFVAFNMAFSIVGGLLSGGSQAVAAYHQKKHNQRDEQKLIELDDRTRALENVVTPGRTTQTILAAGPRHKTSFADAEAVRSDAPSSSPTIH